MTGSALFFTVVGVGYVTSLFMRFILWLDRVETLEKQEAQDNEV